MPLLAYHELRQMQQPPGTAAALVQRQISPAAACLYRKANRGHVINPSGLLLFACPASACIPPCWEYPYTSCLFLMLQPDATGQD